MCNGLEGSKGAAKDLSLFKELNKATVDQSSWRGVDTGSGFGAEKSSSPLNMVSIIGDAAGYDGSKLLEGITVVVSSNRINVLTNWQGGGKDGS